MQIIQELTSPIPRFEVKEDGTEVVTYKAPTSLNIRAANTIKSLVQQLEGLTRAYQSLDLQHNNNLRELDEKRRMVSQWMANEGLKSVRDVPGNAEKS